MFALWVMCMQETSCCFFGHREIAETAQLREQLDAVIENLIVRERVDTFLFGSKSRFDRLCHERVTKRKETYPYIRRVYVRAEFPVIDDSYKAYLLERYEDTEYPEKLLGAGRAVYVERNRELVDRSSFCIVYYLEEAAPKNRKSGTKAALDYAIRKNRCVILLP